MDEKWTNQKREKTEELLYNTRSTKSFLSDTRKMFFVLTMFYIPISATQIYFIKNQNL